MHSCTISTRATALPAHKAVGDGSSFNASHTHTYHWSSGKFSSAWYDTLSILVAKGRAKIVADASASDGPKAHPRTAAYRPRRQHERLVEPACRNLV